jgi:UDP-N-acetylglucosamine 2-epimerase (non-hydrolysing)
MRQRRILIVFGTRPEAIKLFPVAHALAGRPGVDVRTCVTAQHRGLLDQVLDLAGIAPDHDLDIMEPGQSLDRLTARLLAGVGAVLDAEPVDRVVVQGDTVTAFAAALAALYRRIPVAHVEAGLRSGDIRHPWPEEANRRMIAPLADLHFAPTDTAAAALRREGIDRGVHVTGNTGIDALHATCERIAARPSLTAALDPLRARLAGRKLVLVTMHRRESLGDGMRRVAAALAQIARRPDVAILFPVHPHPGIGAIIDGVLGDCANVLRVPPLDYPAFVAALALAHVVLTDSGGVQEEAPALGTPVLVLRDTTERPEGVAAGTARLVGTRTAAIVAAAAELLDDPDRHRAMARAHSPFGDGRAAVRIADLLA